MSLRRRRAALALLLAGLGGCGKVDVHDVGARFKIADTSWFAEEETLFIFYKVRAEQGLSENSVIEITYATDDERVDWTPLDQLPAVHTHLPVDCGITRLCGSMSLHVAKEPREVDLRMRYHRDGELALEADTVYNVVGPGEPWSNRSLVVYGVFEETNQRVQWRSRNQFPAMRNEEATELGLRRWFQIAGQAYGTDDDVASDDNPYGYGAGCPRGLEDAGLPAVGTSDRAVFDEDDLPLLASEESIVCAEATVLDANGSFTTSALARKNPETRAAFPTLHSPIEETTQIPFYLEPCDRVISEDFEEMQRQRLGMTGLRSTCIDDWDAPGFKESLVVAFTDAIEAERANGQDMILVIGLNQDETGVEEVVEQALAEIVPDERDRTSPRLAGAFVFDSEGHQFSTDGLSSSVLWCPASIEGLDTGDLLDASVLACAVLPDELQIDLGPFTFGALPILPTREQYLDFIETFSKSQAGEVTDLSFRAPELATTTEHFDVGSYGVVTFLNEELISAEPTDAFSYCVTDDPWVFMFRSDLLASDYVQTALEEACATGELPQEYCDIVTAGVLPIQYLADWHNQFGEESYDLGLFWDFPFLLHMDYEIVVAGSVSAFGFSVPFGLATPGETYLGSSMWTTESFSLEEQLTQCRRFCDHPTFDSAGVYHVTDPFRTTYSATCYVPTFPAVGDSGFPLDP